MSKLTCLCVRCGKPATFVKITWLHDVIADHMVVVDEATIVKDPPDPPPPPTDADRIAAAVAVLREYNAITQNSQESIRLAIAILEGRDQG